MVRGDKVSAATDNLIYSNIGKAVARIGGIGINANYRLAPEAPVSGWCQRPANDHRMG